MRCSKNIRILFYLQADAYLLINAIRSGINQLEIAVRESIENPQSPEIIRGYSKML